MTLTDQLRQHVTAFWPNQHAEDFVWTLGPISKVLPKFMVIRITPARWREPWKYISLGASEPALEDGRGIEFVILSKTETPRHVETLAMMAHYQADPSVRRDLGAIVRLGYPWMEESRCDRFLISLPYPLGSDFELCQLDDAHLVRFLWLLPITESEDRFIRSSGVEAFERRLEESGLDPVNPKRRAIV